MKKYFLASLLFLFAINLRAQSPITTGHIMGNPFCGGESISVPYTVTTAMNPGNIFTAQLSDFKGSFASPVSIGTLAATGSGTISATLPTGAKTGTKYRVRVVSSSPSFIGSINDKGLKINPKPTNASLSNVTACSATLNWTGTSNASTYKVRFKKTSEPNSAFSSNINAGNVSSYNFTGLVCNTSYDFQVRAVCANGEVSDWKKLTGSTLVCPVPTGGTVLDYCPTTATLDWANATCATGYRIRYKFTDADDWQHYVTSTASTKQLTGLFPATDYTAAVASLCGTDSGAYSANILFQTNYEPCRIGISAGIAQLTIYPNPSDGQFNISLESAQDNTAFEITVTNIVGQVVYSEVINLKEGVNEEKVDLTNAVSGWYLVMAKAGDKIYEYPMVVK